MIVGCWLLVVDCFSLFAFRCSAFLVCVRLLFHFCCFSYVVWGLFV